MSSEGAVTGRLTATLTPAEQTELRLVLYELLGQACDRGDDLDGVMRCAVIAEPVIAQIGTNPVWPRAVAFDAQLIDLIRERHTQAVEDFTRQGFEYELMGDLDGLGAALAAGQRS